MGVGARATETRAEPVMLLHLCRPGVAMAMEPDNQTERTSNGE